jgi:CPA1 family monovalent cation:H+ antiporter
VEALALEQAVVISLIVIVSVALVARQVQLPYTLALVVIGLVLGVLDLIPEIELTPDLILLLFLPPLLFEASYNLDAGHLWRELPAIALLAVPGVLGGAVLIAALVATTLDRSFETALVFGALIAATDPVSVLAVFAKLGAPERLTTIVEGESLFNDGVAIVLYGIVLDAAVGGHVSISEGIAEFIIVAVGGATIGALVGYFATALLRRIDDHMIEITITTVVAFGSFTLAEALHVSGVIAVVLAGLLVGSLRHTSMSATTRVTLGAFWDYLGFFGNSLIFLLIGVRIAAPQLWVNLPAVALVSVAVVLSRATVVLIVNGLLRGLRQPLPWRWLPVVTWGGLRGAVSLALALSLPYSLEDRDWILIVTFGVVLVSLVGQGLTMAPLLSRLGFIARDPYEGERHVARIQAYTRALAVIDQDRQRGLLLPDMATILRDEYEQAIQGERLALQEVGQDPDMQRMQQLEQARRHALVAQRETYSRLRREGQLTDAVARQLLSEVDDALLALQDDGHQPAGHSEPAPER